MKNEKVAKYVAILCNHCKSRKEVLSSFSLFLAIANAALEHTEHETKIVRQKIKPQLFL